MTPNIPHSRAETDGTDEAMNENEKPNANTKANENGHEDAHGSVTGNGARASGRTGTVPDAGPPPATPPTTPAPPAPPAPPTEAEHPAGDGGLSERMEHAVGGFVDDPRGAVREAEAVLDEAAQRLARMLEQRRASLRASVHGASEPDTEELRVALTHYRDMTRRLLDFV